MAPGSKRPGQGLGHPRCEGKTVRLMSRGRLQTGPPSYPHAGGTRLSISYCLECSCFLEARRYLMSKVKPTRGIKKSKNSKLPEPPSGTSPKMRSIKSMVPSLIRPLGRLKRIRLYDRRVRKQYYDQW